MTHPHVDPFDAALVDEPQKFAGKLTAYAYTCVLEKGVGKIPFDPEEHKGRRTSVAIDLAVEPLNPTYNLIQREMLNWTPDFKKIVRPSIEALVPRIAEIRGLEIGQFNPLREITDLWVIGEFVERPDNAPDETWTTLRFLMVFGSEDECKAAYEELTEEEVDETTPTATNNGQRAVMAQFLPNLWQQANKVETEFIGLIKANPMLAEHFDETSPEVQALIDEIPF